MKYLMLYIASFVFSGVGAWSIAKYGSRLGLLDIPSERSSHEIPIPIPKGGGIGILAAFVLSSLVLKTPASFWLPATILALFSFLGDRVKLSPKLRLFVQFIVTLLLVQLSAFSFQLSAFSLFLLVVFIVGTANFYNFMDGINGNSGVTGVVAFALLAFFASLSGNDFSFVTLATCISLSCLGFLPFNMPRAKVFMGDAGSILLGFVFAAMVVVLSNDFLDFVCLTSFLFPFYADELITMAIRIRDGEDLMQAHRIHLYQLLANEKGIAHWKISAGYGILQLSVGLSLLFLRPFGIFAVLPFLTASFLGFSWISFRVRKKVDNTTPR